MAGEIVGEGGEGVEVEMDEASGSDEGGVEEVDI
jgi:hypothetical protein